MNLTIDIPDDLLKKTVTKIERFKDPLHSKPEIEWVLLRLLEVWTNKKPKMVGRPPSKFTRYVVDRLLTQPSPLIAGSDLRQLCRESGCSWYSVLPQSLERSGYIKRLRNMRDTYKLLRGYQQELL